MWALRQSQSVPKVMMGVGMSSTNKDNILVSICTMFIAQYHSLNALNSS